MAAHAGVLSTAGVAFWKYGDRTEVTQKFLEGTKQTIISVRTSLVAEFSDSLSPVLEQALIAGREAIYQLSENGEIQVKPQPYEAMLQILRGEVFGNAISDYVKGNADALTKYRSLIRARDGWLKWSRALSWDLATLLITECLWVTYFSVATQLCNAPDSLKIRQYSFVSSAIFVIIGFVSFLAMLRHHDQIVGSRVDEI